MSFPVLPGTWAFWKICAICFDREKELLEAVSEEILAPVRNRTSIIRVSDRRDTMVSVKSAVPVPKEEIFHIMEKIRETFVTAPIAIGDVLIDSICGTQIVATKEIL